MQQIGRAGTLALLATLVSLAACDGGGTSVPQPASVTATSPQSQEAAAGTAVPEPPTVRVVDEQGRALPGIGVTFAVTGGGGAVANPLATTDASGVATAGSWTLGTGFGTNTVTSTVSGLPAVTFTATGRDPCEVATQYTLLTTLQASLALRDCRLSSGEYVDFHSVAVPEARGVSFTMTSTVVDAFLVLADASGNVLAVDDDSHGGTNAAVHVFFPAGSYLLAATSFDPGETGDYTLASTDLAANSGCQYPWLVPGVQLTQQIATTDCEMDGYYSDDYVVVLRAGQRIRVGMSSGAMDAYVRIFGETGVVAEDDDGGAGTDALLEFTASSFGAYLIEAGTALPGETGAYTLAVTTLSPGATSARTEGGVAVELDRPLWTRAKGAHRPGVRSQERRRP